MVYMDFLPFLWQAVIAAGVSLICYYLLKVRLAWGYWSMLIIAWFGAWIGTPVFGAWRYWTWTSGGTVSYIPAILGAFAVIYLMRGIESGLKK